MSVPIVSQDFGWSYFRRQTFWWDCYIMETVSKCQVTLYLLDNRVCAVTVNIAGKNYYAIQCI